MCCRCKRFCPTETVVGPVETVYRDVYCPQKIRVINPIEVVTRYNCVPVRCVENRYFYRDERVEPVPVPLPEPIPTPFVYGREENAYDQGVFNAEQIDYANGPTISRKKSKAKKSSKSRSKK
ncbi:hypothetical protein SAMN05444162_0258 [Paenibacillaceae bacterium GAS479]|nr:hypothetical protein SAMN05444162_0258 [Paenibacillaceae bacterium GAS479]